MSAISILSRPRARTARPAPTAEGPPRIPLTRQQKGIVLERAETGPWFVCGDCSQLRPDSMAAGRTGRLWFCEICAHTAPMLREAALSA